MTIADDILNLLSQTSLAPAKANIIAGALPGLNTGSVYNTLHKLVKAGDLAKNERGEYLFPEFPEYETALEEENAESTPIEKTGFAEVEARVLGANGPEIEETIDQIREEKAAPKASATLQHAKDLRLYRNTNRYESKTGTTVIDAVLSSFDSNGGCTSVEDALRWLKTSAEWKAPRSGQWVEDPRTYFMGYVSHCVKHGFLKYVGQEGWEAEDV